MEEEKKKCNHEDAMPIGKLPDTSFCWKCKNQLVSNEVEILNMYQEIGGFCDNPECGRYLLLVV